VAIHSTRRASIEQGDTVIVFGAGTVGLLVAAMAKLSGATTVLIADIDTGRVEYALKNRFATRGHVVSRTAHAEKHCDRFEDARHLASAVVEKAYTGEIDYEGADVTFDCTGKEICMQAGLYVRGFSALLSCNNCSSTSRQQDLVGSSLWSEWGHLFKPYRCQRHISKK
jgi:L-iditol 2-dehydrogenase